MLVASQQTAAHRKGLNAAGRAEKGLDEKEVAESVGSWFPVSLRLVLDYRACSKA